MATSRPKQKEPDISEEVLQQAVALLNDDTFSAETLNPALETLYAEMGMSGDGEATVHVTKINADGRGAEANIWRGSPDDYDLERLAKQFGSGDYRVKLYVRIPSGQKVLKGNKVFTWMLSPEEEAKRINPQLNANPQTNPADMARMIAEAVRASIPQQTPPPAPDPIAMMRQFAEITALLKTDAPAQVAIQHDPMKGMRDMVEMMTMLKELQGERDEAPASNANTNDLLLGLINKFGPMFMQLMASQGQAGMSGISEPQAQLQHDPHSPQATEAPAQPAPQTPQPENDVNFKLKMGLNFLIMQCDSGGMPETYAEVVLDSVPSAELQTLVTAPNAIDVLSQFDKRIAEPPRKEWFEKLIAECKDILSQPEEGGESS